MKRWLLVGTGILLLQLSACRREEKFSEIPYIKFVSLEKVDNGTGTDDQANLVFYFEDGDGDIGLDESDTAAIFRQDTMFYYNFLIDYYEKQLGIWTLVPLNPPLHARIPHLSDEVPESIKGEITVLTYINHYGSPYDTVRLSCRLVDRALHVSNVMTTPEIIIQK